MTAGTPPAEIDIDPPLVRALLREQQRELSGLRLKRVDAGWDNVIFRLGDELAVRLPRRGVAVALIKNEQTWLPRLAPRLPLPISLPLYAGRKGCGFPWPWSVTPWLPGVPAAVAAAGDGQAPLLAGFLRALHQPAPPNAPHNPARGVPLSARAETVERRLYGLRDELGSVATLERLWSEALHAPPVRAPRWIHGDLHAQNVLIEKGRISGIIDWGNVCAGDPATDLAGVWMLFENPEARRACLARYEAADEVIARARGWAVFYGTILLEHGLVDNPHHASTGRATLRRLCEDAA